MEIEIAEEDASSLAEYASIPIAFEVSEVLAPEAIVVGGGRAPLATIPVATPYLKDYDAYPANGPLDWAARFDVASWGFLAARVDGRRVGGAVLVDADPAIDLLEGRDDLAVLWDLRVAPAFRRRGVASRLLTAAQRWASARRRRVLKVETQHVNVPACRLYAARGFTIGAVDHAAYPDLPGEVQLLWYTSLAAPGAPAG